MDTNVNNTTAPRPTVSELITEQRFLMERGGETIPIRVLAHNRDGTKSLVGFVDGKGITTKWVNDDSITLIPA